MGSVEIVRQILTSDIIGWILAFFGGFIIFKIVDNMQTKIQRHTVIKDIESEINNLFSKEIAKSNRCEKSDEGSDFVNVRTILHDNTPWEEFMKEKITIENGQRYVQIRSKSGYEEYISTQAIHELMIIFRRVEKLYKDSILKPIDLADMWRELVPFGISGRLEFFQKYLGESDADVIKFVLFNTILACDKYEIDKAVKNFSKAYFDEEKLDRLYRKNNRYTLIEKLKVRRFFKVVKRSNHDNKTSSTNKSDKIKDKDNNISDDKMVS